MTRVFEQLLGGGDPALTAFGQAVLNTRVRTQHSEEVLSRKVLLLQEQENILKNKETLNQGLKKELSNMDLFLKKERADRDGLLREQEIVMKKKDGLLTNNEVMIKSLNADLEDSKNSQSVLKEDCRQEKTALNTKHNVAMETLRKDLGVDLNKAQAALRSELNVKHNDAMETLKKDLGVDYNKAQAALRSELNVKHNDAMETLRKDLGVDHNKAQATLRSELNAKHNDAMETLRKDLGVDHNKAQATLRSELNAKHNDAMETLKKDFEANCATMCELYEVDLAAKDVKQQETDDLYDTSVFAQEKSLEKLCLKEHQILFQTKLNQSKDVIYYNFNEENLKMEEQNVKILNSQQALIGKEMRDSKLAEEQKQKSLLRRSAGLGKILKNVTNNPAMRRFNAEYLSAVKLDQNLYSLSSAIGLSSVIDESGSVGQLEIEVKKAHEKLTKSARKNFNRRQKKLRKETAMEDVEQVVVKVDPDQLFE